MKIVSFYCDIDGKTYYSNCAEILRENCEIMGYDNMIVSRCYGDTWIENVRAKPLFIKEMLETFNEDIIMLDVDSEITRKFPKAKYGWGVMLRQDGSPHDFIHCIKNTAVNYDFVCEWIKEVETTTGGSHSAFINIYESLNTFVIPDGYFKLGVAETKSKTQHFKK